MTEQGERWQIEWDDWLNQWKIIQPEGQSSEEGTQAYTLVATTGSRIVADRIIADHAAAARAEAAEAALREAVRFVQELVDDYPDLPPDPSYGDCAGALDYENARDRRELDERARVVLATIQSDAEGGA